MTRVILPKVHQTTLVLLAVLAALPSVLMAGQSDSEPPPFTIATWTARDGLPSSYVLALAQDAEGYLWVGTTGGLSRFDGHKFTPWPMRGAFPSPTPVVNAVIAARDGSLWMSFQGPSRIVRDHHGEVTVFTTHDGLPEGTVRALVETRDGTIWCGGAGGLARFKDGRWEHLPGRLGTPEPNVASFAEDTSGRLWVGTPGGVFRADAGGERFEPVRTEVTGNALLSPLNNDVAFTAGARVHVLRHGEAILSVRTFADRAIGPFPLAHDRRGNHWIGTNGEGLLVLNPGQPEGMLRLTERDGLAGDLIRKILRDRDGNMWIGTQAGLSRVTEATITSIRARAATSAENVTRLTPVQDEMWVHSLDGLVRFSKDRRMLAPDRPDTPIRNITSLHTDREGRLWVAAGGQLLVRQDGRFRTVRLHKGAEPAPIAAITSDARGHLWLHDTKRLLQVDAGALIAGRAADAARVEVPRDILGPPVRFVLVDARDRIWVGVDGAVAVGDQGAFRTYTEDHGLPAGQLAGAHEDPSGRVWIASDNGLSTLEGGRFITLTTANGLPSNRILFVVEDNGGDLWLGISAGIVRVHRDELERAVATRDYRVNYRLFDESDGLKGTPVNRGTPTAAPATDGAIWFITSNGLAVLDPRRIPNVHAPPRALLSEVIVNGQPHAAAAGVTLPARVSSLQIEFATINLTSPSRVRFRHRLDGVDATWVDDGAKREAVYAKLTPGSYRFLVEATNGEGVWSERPTMWTFTVPPLWYQTRTFYVLGILTIALLVASAWRVHVRQIQKQFSMVLAERARVGREIHDTLLQSLVGLGLQMEDLADELNAPIGVLKRRLMEMRRQVEHYVGEAQQSIWDLRSPAMDTTDLATAIRERAERITKDSGIAFELLTTGSPRPLPSHVQRQVLRIAQEAVVNAVRHASPTKITVEMTFEGDAVHLRVTDNGHGFNPEMPTPSGESHWGMSIMRERVEQIGGRFSVSSAPNRGTRIEIVAPAPAEVA